MYAGPLPAAKRRRVAKPTAARGYNMRTKRTPKGPAMRGPLSSRVKSLASVVKKTLPEMKYREVNIDINNIAAASAGVLVTSVANGTQPDQRVGDCITIHNLQFGGYFEQASDVTNVPNTYFRVVVYVDKQQVADTVPAPSTVFSYTNPLIAWPDPDSQDRFRILHMSRIYDMGRVVMDSDYLLPTNLLVPSESGYWMWSWSGTLKVSFNGDTAGDIQKNGVYVGILTNTDGNMDFVGTALVGYTDS